MNLNYDPSKETLKAFIDTANNNKIHNLVIDFDGEVVIDPEDNYPDVSIDSFKFSTHILDASLRNENTAEALYAALYVVYESLEEPADASIAYQGQKMAA